MTLTPSSEAKALSSARMQAFLFSSTPKTSGIRVNCVAPGVVDTEMNACYDEDAMAELAEKTPLGKIGDPEEIARAVFFLASENASFVTGQTLTVDGGFLS
ncbi:MAG: SDR family oxidoreductase [Clostridia bacterium]|nr:SDR family oxidoreductase [Clostridia bacterium]